MKAVLRSVHHFNDAELSSAAFCIHCRILLTVTHVSLRKISLHPALRRVKLWACLCCLLLLVCDDNRLIDHDVVVHNDLILTGSALSIIETVCCSFLCQIVELCDVRWCVSS